MKEMIRSGEAMLAAVQRSDTHQEVMHSGAEVPAGVLNCLEKEVDVAWVKQRGLQQRLRTLDSRRADALLGFGVGDEAEQATPVKINWPYESGFI
jgi:hypothetical protein